MRYHHVLLVIHLLSAAIWVGGHIVLLVGIVPAAVANSDKRPILDFEARYGRIGLPSLLFLVASGIAMALNYGVMPHTWFTFSNPIETIVSIKLILLLITVGLAISAQLKVVPGVVRGTLGLKTLVWHITGVTLIGISMLVLGTFVRFG